MDEKKLPNCKCENGFLTVNILNGANSLSFSVQFANFSQCDLLELRDAHAKLRTSNEKLRLERERYERERDSFYRRGYL